MEDLYRVITNLVVYNLMLKFKSLQGLSSMEYRVIFKPLTEMSNQFIRKQNPYLNSAEDVKEVIINAMNEHHAVHIFMTMIQHSGIRVAQYRVESLCQKNDLEE